MQITEMPDDLIANLDEAEAVKGLKSPEKPSEKVPKKQSASQANHWNKLGGTLGTISEKRALEEEMSSTSISSYMTP